MAEVDERLVVGREGQSGIEDEKLMPEAHKERTFSCGVCGDKVKAVALNAVCTGVDFGVAVTLPDGEVAIYKNGLDGNGNPSLVPGRVVKVSRADDYVVYSHDGREYLSADFKWEANATREVPGEHSPQEMKEVK